MKNWDYLTSLFFDAKETWFLSSELSWSARTLDAHFTLFWNGLVRVPWRGSPGNLQTLLHEKAHSLTAWQRQLIHHISLDLIISGCANMQQNRAWEGNPRGHSSSHLASVVVEEAWIQVGRGDVDQRLECGISLPGLRVKGATHSEHLVFWWHLALVPSVWGTIRKKSWGLL